ncbi:STAS-like domain-containing protein [Pseudomonas fulva]|uniref:STAS-like domain-containing protein n=1 Tax=Pseudomonas fulva TaxID=47880 RepID=UPI00201DE73A|nr:STAS-like domain-containing protein [Pseudomonas fulva]UQY33838.1 STAS-like domain-containing protein [Pseudomonas fulva]
MTSMTIHVAKEFTKLPCVRLRDDGKKSGEEFREDILLPALKRNDKVVVDLNGVLTLGSSFLEETFGGLVRKGYFTAKELKSRLEIKFQVDSYVKECWDYVGAARKE